MFGPDPSEAAFKALTSFRKNKITNIVELGAGLGRDTLYFANNSIHVESLDYSKTSVAIITNKSNLSLIHI